MSCKQVRFALIYLVLSSGLVSAQETCNMPREGEWRMEMGQTMTVQGPGGGPAGQDFSLTVEGCGEEIVLTGFGAPETGAVKRMSRQSDGSYGVQIPFRGIAYVAWKLNLTSQEKMSLSWAFGTAVGGQSAWADGDGVRGSASLTKAYSEMGRLDPRCACPLFVDQLRESIENSRIMRDFYANPIVYTRPDTMPDKEAWRAKEVEDVAELFATHDITIQDAVDRVVEQLGADDETPENTPDNTGATDTSVQASTDCDTCKIQMKQQMTGCAADVIQASIMAHEKHHASVCNKLKKMRADAHPLDLPLPPKYCLYASDPLVHAAEEVEAYEADIAYTKDAFKRMCKRELN